MVGPQRLALHAEHFPQERLRLTQPSLRRHGLREVVQVHEREGMRLPELHAARVGRLSEQLLGLFDPRLVVANATQVRDRVERLRVAITQHLSAHREQLRQHRVRFVEPAGPEQQQPVVVHHHEPVRVPLPVTSEPVVEELLVDRLRAREVAPVSQDLDHLDVPTGPPRVDRAEHLGLELHHRVRHVTLARNLLHPLRLLPREQQACGRARDRAAPRHTRRGRVEAAPRA